MRRGTRLAALAGLFVLATLALQLPDLETHSPAQRESRATPSPTPTPRPLTKAQINRQDRTSPRQRRRETSAFDDRPLLAALPLELAGMRIDIAGLGADNRTTILELTAGPRGRSAVRAFYRRTLAAYGDSGTAYAVRWAIP